MAFFLLVPRRPSVGTLSVITLLGTTLACGGPAPGTDGAGGAGSDTGGQPATGGSTNQTGGSGNGSGGDGAASGGAASGGAASGGAASGGSSNGNPVIGTIQSARTLALGTTSPGRATATFDYVEQAAWIAFTEATQTCTKEQLGDCYIKTCEPTGAEPEEPSTARLEAGTITLVPDRDDFTATGAPGGEDNLYTFTGSGTILGEEIMTVTASGGVVGAFQGTVQIPLAPFLLSHEATATETGTVVAIPAPRTEDLTITWDARGVAQAMWTTVKYPTDDRPVTLHCTFDAAPGSGTILASALNQLPAGAEIHLFAVNSNEVTTPQGNVALLGAMEMLSPDRAAYPMFVVE